jgi:RHS repeat-associated protein
MNFKSSSPESSSSGALLGTIKYAPFGQTRSITGSIATDKLFTGQILDDTGLYYYNARYYDPTIGRFISADTVIPNPANPQCFNRYSYCLNNPLRYTDPSGHLVYDEDGNLIDTSDPYWIEEHRFADPTFKPSPTMCAWNDFVYSGGAATAALAHLLERDPHRIQIEIGDAGDGRLAGTGKQFEWNSKENAWNFIPQKITISDKYRDDPIQLAALLAHEVFHCITGLNGFTGNTYFEEACAWSYYESVINKFGAKNLNPALTGLRPFTDPVSIDRYLSRYEWTSSGGTTMYPNDIGKMYSLYVQYYPNFGDYLNNIVRNTYFGK